MNLAETYPDQYYGVVPGCGILGGTQAQLNAKVDRFDADRAAVVWTAKNFTRSGALRLPTLPLHNRWDPLVPYFHEGMVAERVANAGATILLLQRASPAWEFGEFGHCVIPAVDQAQAIEDMAKWVKPGVKPAP